MSSARRLSTNGVSVADTPASTTVPVDYDCVAPNEEYPRFLHCCCKPLLCCCCISLECWLRIFSFGFVVFGLAGILGIPGVVEDIYLFEGVFYCFCSILSVAIGILIWTALARESARIIYYAANCLLWKYLLIVAGYVVAIFFYPNVTANAWAVGLISDKQEHTTRSFGGLVLPPLLLDGLFYLVVYYFMWSYAILVEPTFFVSARSLSCNSSNARMAPV